jgi:hypothetical protein
MLLQDKRSHSMWKSSTFEKQQQMSKPTAMLMVQMASTNIEPCEC